MSDEVLLRTALSAAVPLRILELKVRGGPDDFDRERVQGFSDILGSRGDQLLYRSKKKGETAEMFNGLADALAVMAFVPGGVKFLGMHFEEKV